MRSIYKIVVCSLLTLSITSCEKDLLEKEQYQKEIYLIGAYNRVWTTEVSYSNEEVKTYFTVSSSGTLALDRDVNVKMKINEELVDIYNKKYWTVLNEDKYYKSLDTDLYSIPSLENTVIKHAEGISTEVPVLIKTASLKIDQSYVIPVEIESTTGYPVSTSGYKMLVLLKLKNEYSGSYQMSGHTTLEGETPKTIQKPKTIKPTGVNTVRLFYAMNNESDEKYYDGMLLRIPLRDDPSRLGDLIRQDKMFEIFKEHHRWQKILEMSTVGDFNDAVKNGHSTDLINVSEALQEKKISQIADMIAARKGVRVVLISGPSSSGKTTFCKRLSIQLLTCGIKPVQISLDDYFVNRELTPKDDKGDYDYESLYALNIPLLNEQLNALFAGEEVELPRYNFQSGRSEKSGRKLKLLPDNVLVVEGIHALNPELTAKIPEEQKFRVYASALTTILLDTHNYIPTTDNRLLRRIIRDYKYRGVSAAETIRRWPSVRAGENKWIFPYQENADVMFNSALLFELAVIKSQAEPLLELVPENMEEHAEAYRLLKFLKYIAPIPNRQLPPTSLLREFLGGSSFKY